MTNLWKTAKTRTKISLPLKLLLAKNLIQGEVLDYGCGKGFDADHLGADKYDPYFYPQYPNQQYDTIICIFVINIINNEEIQKLIENIKNLLKNDGIAYIATHSDKRKKQGINRYKEINLPIFYHHQGILIYKVKKYD